MEWYNVPHQYIRPSSVRFLGPGYALGENGASGCLCKSSGPFFRLSFRPFASRITLILLVP